MFEEKNRQKIEKALREALPSIPTVARASVKIARECGENEVHLIVPRGNMIINEALQQAMRLTGKNAERILLPLTQVGTYKPGELEEILRTKTSRIPPNTIIHYIDECNTGDNGVQISKALKKITEEKNLKLKIDLIANNRGENIILENRKKLKTLKAVIHPVTEIPWMDNPIIEGYVWSKNLLNIHPVLEGVNEKNAKKINKTFNYIMYNKHDWVKDKKQKKLKIIRYDSPEYLKRPLQVLTALYQAFKKTGLAKKYKVGFDKKNQVIYINNNPFHSAQLLENKELIKIFTQKEDPNKEIDKYTLLRIGMPYSHAAIEYRRQLTREIEKTIKNI